MYDIIGDIHGYATPLKDLLSQMDYREKDGIWQHPSRKAIFVGDYIDRGPAIREVLSIVRGMQENNHAITLMGNHEYNALAYAFQKADGSYLRRHSDKNTHQHQETLRQFEDYPGEWQSYLQWFKTLPLYLDLPELRAIHACWDQPQVDWLKQNGFDTMSDHLLQESHVHGSKAYEVINDLLKGKEFNIPAEYVWADKDGHPRTKNRIKWWKHPENASYGEFLFNCPDDLFAEMIAEKVDAVIYDPNAPPVFFGHYWLEDKYPVIQADNVVCLDYSIAKGGSLVGYQWQGEKKVDPRHFVTAP